MKFSHPPSLTVTIETVAMNTDKTEILDTDENADRPRSERSADEREMFDA
jgi:hypothetical protein